MKENDSEKPSETHQRTSEAFGVPESRKDLMSLYRVLSGLQGYSGEVVSIRSDTVP